MRGGPYLKIPSFLKSDATPGGPVSGDASDALRLSVEGFSPREGDRSAPRGLCPPLKKPKMVQNDQKWPQKGVLTPLGPSGPTNFDSSPHFTPTVGDPDPLGAFAPHPDGQKGSKKAQKGPKWLKITKKGPKRGSRRHLGPREGQILTPRGEKHTFPLLPPHPLPLARPPGQRASRTPPPVRPPGQRVGRRG